MEKKLWFKRKTYGWGWTPVSFEGWLVLLIYAAVNIWIFRNLDALSHSGSDTLIAFAPRFLALAAILYFICIYKGEKPKWQWGKKSE